MRSPRRARGAALLIAVMLVFAVGVFGALMASSMSSSDVVDSSYQGYAVEAFYAAETGLERALKRFSSGTTACGALGGGAVAVDAANAPGRTFTTIAKGASDFSGVANTLPNSQCRVQVTGDVAGTNVRRILQAVLNRDLLASANPDFNDPVGGAGQWTTTGRWDAGGGPDCTRAMYVVKPRNAPGANASSGLYSINLPTPVTGATGNVTVRFNYRVTQVANSGVNQGCATNTAAAACPTGGVNPAANDATICVQWNGAAMTAAAGARTFATGVGAFPSIGPAVVPAACNPTTVSNPLAYPTCASRYTAGTPVAKGSVTVPAPAGGTINSIQIRLYLRASGTAREMWVDNFELINNTAKGAARVIWRDCSMFNCV